MVIRLDENYNAMASTALLGYVGETNARPVSVEGLTVDGADRYVLTIDYGDGVQYEVDITGGQWTPTADVLRSAQTVSCQICAKKLSGNEYILLKKSRIFRLRIGAAIGDNAIPSPDVAVDALDKIDAIGRQAHADMQTAVTAADTATTMANNAAKSATAAEKSADTAEQAASRAETAKTAAETSATQAENAKQGAETARAEAVKSQNDAKVSAAQASTAAQQTEADKTITAGYAKTAKTCADSTTADRQAVQEMVTQVTADKTTVADHAAKVAADRKAAETAAQTAQSIADSLPEDYTTAVGKIAENTAEIANVKLTDKELQRRVNALYSIGQGITHQFETDTDTAYTKAVPTGAKLMSVKSVGGRSITFNQMYKKFDYVSGGTLNCKPIFKSHKYLLRVDYSVSENTKVYLYFRDAKYTAETNRQITKDVAAGSGKISWITSPLGEHSDGGDFGVFRMVTDSDGSQKLDTSPFSNHEIFDLTTMFGSGNEPSTVEEFEKIFPADYYPYNAGEIVSAGTEEIVEQGANLYYGTDMLKVGSDDYEYIANSYRCKSIKLKPNTTYTLSFNSDKTSEIILLMNVNANVNAPQYFDFRKASHTQTYTTGDDGCLYVSVYAGNGAVASADVVKRLSECQIMITESDTPTAYAPYHRNVYQIPDTIKALPGYGWSAGTARNYVDYENKKYVQCVDSVDLGALNWVAGSTGKVNFQTSQVIGQKLTKSYSIAPNFMCLKYSTKTQDELWGKPNVIGITAAANVDGFVYVNDTSYTDVTAFKQAMQGVILYYELANPIITDISNLIDDDFLRNIEVEAGGSVTFKNSNGDSYRIPVPSEEEYIVKLSEVGGTT